MELSDRLNFFQVPKLLLLHQTDIQKDSDILFDQISDFFKGRSVVIRSSANDEDGKLNSSAGKYHSELNVSSKNKDSIILLSEQMKFGIGC